MISRRDIELALIGGGGKLLLDLLFATVRFDVRGAEHCLDLETDAQPVIYALWHGRLLPATYLRRGEGMATLISRHRDGSYITRIAERWGFRVVRGSSSRGGDAALRALAREIRAGNSVALTPDGPRGPREKMKPGALQLAQLTGAPIIPAATGARRAWWFEGWDRFLVPRPFSTVRVAYGEPIPIGRGLDESGFAARLAEVEAAVVAVTREVDARQ